MTNYQIKIVIIIATVVQNVESTETGASINIIYINGYVECTTFMNQFWPRGLKYRIYQNKSVFP
jgi:hypothetical protein